MPIVHQGFVTIAVGDFLTASRADVNSTHDALLSCHYSDEGTEPTTTLPGMLWIDASDEGPFHFVSSELPDGPADVAHTGNGPRSGWTSALIIAAINGLEERLDRMEKLEAVAAAAAPFGKVSELVGAAMPGTELTSYQRELIRSLDALNGDTATPPEVSS